MTAGAISALPILPREFYVRPATEVARNLLGMLLVHRDRAGLIVETEAYLGLEDRAAHAWHGRTPRTEVIFGPPGHAYVYLIYGMYECLNVVAEPEGSPGCVLIRALEPVCGLTSMRRCRPTARRPHDLCSGPGKLTLAMGVTRRDYGADLTHGPFTIRELPPPAAGAILHSPRIGIRHEAERPLRFFLGGNPYVSSGHFGEK